AGHGMLMADAARAVLEDDAPRELRIGHAGIGGCIFGVDTLAHETDDIADRKGRPGRWSGDCRRWRLIGLDPGLAERDMRANLQFVVFDPDLVCAAGKCLLRRKWTRRTRPAIDERRAVDRDADTVVDISGETVGAGLEVEIAGPANREVVA